MMTQAESTTLIAKIQKKKSTSSDELKLYNEFIARYRPHKQENYLYDPDELRTEFLLACWNAVYKAKLDVGDPMMYCIKRGNMAMIDYYRKVSSEKLMLICRKCGHVMAYDRRNTSCHKCGCTNLVSKEREVTMDFGIYNPETVVIVGQDIDLEDTITEIVLFLKTMEDVGILYRRMAIDALKTKTDFYNYARGTGKSHSWAISFKQKIIKALHPMKDRYMSILI